MKHLPDKLKSISPSRISLAQRQMSLPRPKDAQANGNTALGHRKPQHQQSDAEVSSHSGVSRSACSDNCFSDPPISRKKSREEESDEELLMVPDMEALSAPVNSAKNNNSSAAAGDAINSGNSELQNPNGFPEKRRRGRNPVDKEYRRLKRLLRNRVSAQQARERKKVYMNDLEARAQELQDRNAKLEEKISTLINENTMLRKVLMNTRPKADEKVEGNS